MKPVTMKSSISLLFLCVVLMPVCYIFRHLHFKFEVKPQNVGKGDVTEVTTENKLMFENGYKNVKNADFLLFLRYHWIVSPSSKPRALRHPHKRQFSQVGQSLKVEQLLHYKKDGFFIECGAADGETYSNSLNLEIAYNWTGLLIEPNPDLYQKLLAKNRNAYLLNACLSTEAVSGKMDFLLEGLFGGLSEDTGHAHDTKVTQVQCFPLLSVLLSLGNPTVDYFSLDVEGAELPILQTVPWKKVDIKVIGIEYRVIHPRNKTILEEKSLEKLKQLRDFFIDTGFYKEVGILPRKRNTQTTEKYGLDVFFQKIER